MSTHVDSVTLAKRSGDNAVELQVFHVQVMFAFCSQTAAVLIGWLVAVFVSLWIWLGR